MANYKPGPVPPPNFFDNALLILGSSQEPAGIVQKKKKAKKRAVTRKAGETRGRKPGPELVDVRLNIKHNINGMVYGPGMAYGVPKATADLLLEQESRFVEVEAMLHAQGSAIIGAGNRLIRVNPDYFDHAMETASPVSR